MKKFEIKYPPGATPLSAEEREGLIPDYISNHGELNELEQQNIQNAILWIRSRKSFEVLDVGFLCALHKEMFGEVWRWAGRFRTSGKNIGVDWHQISTHLGQLIADAKYWKQNQTYSMDEIGARFHHRLVQIHAFPNGNGRHARLTTDLLLKENGHEPFTWGMKSSSAPLEAEGERRKKYIAALALADQHQYAEFMTFVRS